MKEKDALKLNSGQKVMHNRYGECIVKEVIVSFGELFGVVVTPITDVGKSLLMSDSKTDIPDFLESLARHLSS